MNKFLISAVACILSFSQFACAADLSNNLLQPRTAQPVQFGRRMPTLEEMIQRGPYPGIFMQPIPLRGVNISGLQPKNVETLGFNYFIVVDNSRYNRMSDIYRETRQSGKSNFVTADSIIHPYLAFSNRVLADVALKQIEPDLLALLEGMQRVAIDDYKDADDADVRDDIARNIGYLGVAMKLLNPRYVVPNVGKAPDMVAEDIQSILDGHRRESAVFSRPLDFTLFKPIGWYSSSPELQNFYRARQWLSEISFPITDISAGEEGHGTNAFRRSVLLYRSLDTTDVLGRPATEVWAKVLRAFSLFGTPVDSWHERTLYPTDYKLVFTERPANLKVTLQALAEPLYRTKLMLAVRRQKPMNLSATSIFELDDDYAEASGGANFRLFPVVCQPETRWMHSVARVFPTDKQSAAAWPVGLLDMYAWGSPMAGNVLSELMWTLDPKIAQALPELQHCVLRRTASGQTLPIDSRCWKILTPYFKPLPEGAAGALRTELWGSRKLVSAMGGWVDSLAAIAPPNAGAQTAQMADTLASDNGNLMAQSTAEPSANSASPITGNAKEPSRPALSSTTPADRAGASAVHAGAPAVRGSAPPASRTTTSTKSLAAQNEVLEQSTANDPPPIPKGPCVDCIKAVQKAIDAEAAAVRGEPVRERRPKIPPYHYLEPSTELYHQLEADALKLQTDLASLHYLPDEYKPRFGDFMRLFERLAKISDLEMRGGRISPVDNRLLGNIDLILDRVDVPLPAVLPFEAPQRTAVVKRTSAQVKLSSGRPATMQSRNSQAQHNNGAIANGNQVQTQSSDDDSSTPSGGFNLAVGRPGLLYIIYQNPRSLEWTLGRGAVYTYYETPAPLLTQGMWQHKVDAGFAKPLNWTGKYEVVQQQMEPRTSRTASTNSGIH